MKSRLTFILAAVFAIGILIVPAAKADDVTFTVSASVPSATNIDFNVSKVTDVNGTLTFVKSPGTEMSFNPLTLDAEFGIYRAPHFFAIDVGVEGGAGVPDNITFTYTEGNNPNNDPNHGLGVKAAATFVKAGGAQEVLLTAHGPKKLLKNLQGEAVDATEVLGGWLRVYLGLLDGNASTTPTGGEPFTNADMHGDYSGTLYISATLL